MKRIACDIAAFSLIAALSLPAHAAQLKLDGAMQTAQRAIELRQFKKAETTLKRAFASATDARDANLARAQVLLATALRQQGKYAQASDALNEAKAIYKQLGFVEPAYVDESKTIAANHQLVELAKIGAGAEALSKNAAVISMIKSEGNPGAAAHVEIRMSGALQNSLSNAKIDGIQLEPVVSFDIEQAQPGAIHAANIKGFKIHSVEKNMWVNLLDVTTGSADSEGKYEAVITAGKAGITKTVPAKLPFKAYEPIAALASQLNSFGLIAEIDLPVQTPTATATTETTPAQPSRPVSAPASVTTVTESPSAPASVTTVSDSAPAAAEPPTIDRTGIAPAAAVEQPPIDRSSSAPAAPAETHEAKQFAPASESVTAEPTQAPAKQDISTQEREPGERGDRDKDDEKAHDKQDNDERDADD